MSKLKELKQKTAKKGIKKLIIVAVFSAVYGAAYMFSAETTKQKMAAESKYTTDSSKLKDYQSQIDKSDEADKRYAAIMGSRSTQKFSSDVSIVKDWFRESLGEFKLSGPQLTLGTVNPSDRPEFTNMAYTIQLRQPMSLKFKAISDVHVFSFIEDMARTAPGLVRIDSLKMKRLADITDANIANIRTGTSVPLLVEVSMDLTWIGLQLKDKLVPDPSGNPVPPVGN